MFITILVLAFSFNLAAQIDNRNNYSPEWLRSAIRNSSVDGADVAIFNPAGATYLEEGIHIGLGNQSLFRSPEHRYTLSDVEVSHTQDGADYIFPSLFLAYRENSFAITGGLFVSGGGATANYPNGSFSTDLLGFGAVMGSMGAYTQANDQYLEASSYYLTSFLGAAYQLSEKLSLGANIRYLMGRNETTAGFTLDGSPMMLPAMPVVIDISQEANGLGASFGAMYRPTEKLDISVRYDLMVPLEFETSVKRDDAMMFTDGEKSNRDLPAVLASGVSYRISEKVRLATDFNYYFQSSANWGNSSPVTEEKPVAELAGDAYSVSLGTEIKLNQSLLFSFGVMRTILDFEDRDAYYTTMGAFETVPGNNTSINTGIRYSINPNLDLNLGVANVIWDRDQEIHALMIAPSEVFVTTNNQMLALGIGINARF